MSPKELWQKWLKMFGKETKETFKKYGIPVTTDGDGVRKLMPVSTSFFDFVKEGYERAKEKDNLIFQQRECGGSLDGRFTAKEFQALLNDTLTKDDTAEVDIYFLIRMLGKSRLPANILFGLVALINKKDKRLHLFKGNKESLAVRCGCTVNHIDITVSRLVKKGILSREGRGVYKFHPETFRKTKL